MSSLPPSSGYPSTPPPTAQPPGPGEGLDAEPVTQVGSRLSPVLTGVVGVVVGAGLALAIALPLALSDGGASGSAAGSPHAEVLVAAVEACGSPLGVRLEDEGATVAFDHRGEDEVTGGDLADLMCVFTELDMPSRISTHMGQTTSMDGRQSATWDGLEIQWSYHPDRGMDGMITVAPE